MNEMTQKYLMNLLSYNKDTGEFVWKVARGNNRVKPGDVAGGKKYYGYVCIKINQKDYRAHRLAWLYVYGYFPKHEIDHINRITDDNRIANLREASHSQNMANSYAPTKNKSGHRNVHWDKKRKKWYVSIQFNRKKKYIGCFSELKDAKSAAFAARKKYHGEFACHT